VFTKETGVKFSEVQYYWPTFSKLVKEAGGEVNEFKTRLPDDVVFCDYARICLHLRRDPDGRRASHWHSENLKLARIPPVTRHVLLGLSGEVSSMARLGRR